MSRTCPDCHNTYDDDILHCPEDGVSLAADADDLIGRNVGSYRVVKLLGKGGMGSVYMGEHPVIGSKVAIKFLHPQYSHDEKIVDRFFNEARAVNLIGHDNILKILDLNVTDDNRHYFVMEFLYGRPLQSLLKGGATVPLETAGPILLQICDALGAAHAKGIVHRDLKPDNVYLIRMKGKKNFVKVVDFGIAKLTNPEGVSTGKTQTGMVMGTPAYMSPEQASGKTQIIDGRSDVYSLGVMMFHLATGKLPFPGSSFGDVLIGHIQTPPPRPRSLNPSIPEGYEPVILKTLEKRQQDRFQTMAELHESILTVMQQLGISAELPPSDQTEELDLASLRGTPSNPGARTPSQPGRTTPRPRSAPGSSRPGARPGARAAGTSRPGARASNPRFLATESATMPATGVTRSKTPLVIAIVAGVALVLGGVGYVVQKALTTANEAKATAELARKADRPAPPQPAPENETVIVAIDSEPSGAQVKASWRGGEKDGLSPLALEAPKNAKVHLEIAKSGYLPYTSDIVADAPQTYTARLTAVVVASPVPPPVREHESKPSRPTPSRTTKKEKPKTDLPAKDDGLIDIDEALK